MAETILRKGISNAITELASPADKRSAFYQGPKSISDDPIRVVLDGNQGGLPVRRRESDFTVSSPKVTHDFEVFQVPLDEEWLLRAIELEVHNGSFSDIISVDLRMATTPGGQSQEVMLSSISVNQLQTQETRRLCRYAYQVTTAGRVTGGGPTMLANYRFSPGDKLRIEGEELGGSKMFSISANWIADISPIGVFVAV